MKVLDLGHLEAQFGLIIREKENHDNYVLLRFEDLHKVVEYYNSIEDVTKNIRDPSKIFVQTQCMDAITRKTLRRVAYNRYDDWCKSRESR